MVMKRCANGHFYDNSKYQQCPYCGISGMGASGTMPIVRDRSASIPSGGSAIGKTVAKESDSDYSLLGRTAAISPAPARRVSDDGRTVSVYQSQKGIEPVVGWLVCIEGASKGQDYRIKPERNFIGRDSSMDIAISGDQSISREKHAIISYSSKTDSFKLVPGDSHGIIYLNNEEVYMPVDLRRGDIIELGETVLIFIPLCGEGFRW